MALLTIFSAPKPFINPHITTIQRNALQCWVNLPDVEVFLVGEETGLKETAEEFGVRVLAEVRRNELGTPLVSSIFSLAREASQSALMIYTNADMLYTSALVEAAHKVAAQATGFLVVGQRWDVDVRQPLDFSAGWERRLEEMVKGEGRLHPPQGSDYFIFPRGLFAGMPDFAIGRAGWDNWMIYEARRQGWPVVDGTKAVLAIHQNHDYSHLPGGKPHYDLKESHQNTALAGGLAHMYNMLDTTAVLVDGKLRPPAASLARLVRRSELALMPREDERHGPRWWVVRRLRRLRRRLTG